MFQFLKKITSSLCIGTLSSALLLRWPAMADTAAKAPPPAGQNPTPSAEAKLEGARITAEIEKKAPLVVKVKIENLDADVIAFEKMSEDLEFDIEATDGYGLPLPKTPYYQARVKNAHFVSPDGVRLFSEWTLTRQENYLAQYNLAKLFQLSTPGRYKFRFSQDVILVNRPHHREARIYSNWVSVDVKAPILDKSPLTKVKTAAPVLVIPLVVPNFKGASDGQIAKLRDSLEAQQNFLRDTILEQLQDGRLSPVPRVESIALLSMFRPNSEITSALIRNLNVVALERPDETGADSDRYHGYIARSVMATSVPNAEKIILNVINSEEPTAAQLQDSTALKDLRFDSAKAEGYAGVLSRIEGKQNALSILQAAQARATTPAIKAQFQKVIDAVNKGEKSPITY